MLQCQDQPTLYSYLGISAVGWDNLAFFCLVTQSVVSRNDLALSCFGCKCDELGQLGNPYLYLKFLLSENLLLPV